MNAIDVMMRGQARLIKDSAEAWSLEAPSSRRVRLIEKTIAMGLDLIAELQEEVSDSWQAFRQLPRDFPTQKVGERFRLIFDDLPRSLALLEKSVRLATADGEPIPLAESYYAAHQRALNLMEWFHKNWPMLDVAEAEAASARIAAGQFVTLEDLAGVLDGPV